MSTPPPPDSPGRGTPPSRRPPAFPAAPSRGSADGSLELLPPAPPAVPRPLTPAARHRAWLEPKVRFWWISTLVLLAIAGWFVIKQIDAYHSEQKLIATGTKVTATIDAVNGDHRTGAKFPPGSPCELSFKWQDRVVHISATLTPTSDQDFLVNGQTVTLRIDPNDPSVWTDRTEPEPVIRGMIAAVVLIPVVLITLFSTWSLRRKVLVTWRDGIASAYVVHDLKHTVLALLSLQVRCAIGDGTSNRLIAVYLPARQMRLKPGDLLWVIHPRGKAHPALAALAFE